MKKAEDNSPTTPSMYIKSHSNYATFNSKEFLRLLNCSNKKSAKIETIKLLDQMLNFQNLRPNVKDFIDQLRDLSFLSDMNAEIYWSSLGLATNVQRQVGLYNEGMSSSIDSAREVRSNPRKTNSKITPLHSFFFKRKHEEVEGEEDTSVPQRRPSIPIKHDDFIDSGEIEFEDGTIESPSTDSPSIDSTDYQPSDLSTTIVGYTCKLNMCELRRKDMPKETIPIADEVLASLFSTAQEQAVSNMLFPHDINNRLHASGIFSSALLSSSTTGEKDKTVELPGVIYKNIMAFKRAIQQNKLYVQPYPTTTIEESCLNTIILSTYTFHGKPLIKNKFSELNLIASSLTLFVTPFFCAHDIVQIEWDATSWVYTQLNHKTEDSKRPDILFYFKSDDCIIEIGCGEVKKDETCIIEAKARVLETMKRQLHLRMKFANNAHEIITFGILVIGTEIILFKLNMDMTKWVYIYEESKPFTLPTTHDTHSHMEIAMEVMAYFKDQMLKSIKKLDKDSNNSDNVWSLFKDHVLPTVSFFKALHQSDI